MEKEKKTNSGLRIAKILFVSCGLFLLFLLVKFSVAVDWLLSKSTQNAIPIATPSVVTQQPLPTTVPAKDVEILKIDNKATEKNNVWWRYSWLVTLRNNTQKSVSVHLTLKWVDEANLVLDSATESVILNPGETRNVNDYNLITVETAPSVKDLQVEAKW